MRPEDLIIRPKHPLDPNQVLANLNHALKSRNSDEIDGALLAAFQVGLRHEFVSSFIGLLDLPDHHRHEDIVGGLQELKDPRAVDAIYRAAFVKHKYLAYDEFFGLARKCTWALADIGTEDAFAKLQLLAASDDPVIAGYAQKRIDNWQKEKDRKKI
jgi:hypothetical protein